VSDQDLYNQLADYTLTHLDPSFIHQEVVDAYAAQHATEKSKPVYLTFALVGLYLFLEKGYTGRQVQLAHMQMAKRRKNWPKFEIPENRGNITIEAVLAAKPGPERDEMIRKWCQSTWDAYSSVHKQIHDLVKSELYQNV
jgi:hypothetical protein